MPKIRCKGCQTVLNIPDKARGKVVACPKCSTKLRVPGGDAAPPKKAKVKKKAASNDPFESLNLDAFEDDEDASICPYCAAELDEEDPVCRNCGMNVETGRMDAKEKRRRAIKGPDPAKFYSDVWKDSWRFMWKEKGLCLKSGTYWSLFIVLNAMCTYLGVIYCVNFPPRVFWISLAGITALGIPGWYWYLGAKIIEPTALKLEFRSDRIHFDFFQAIAFGLRAAFWPLVIGGPITLAVIGVADYLVQTDQLDQVPESVLIVGGSLWGAFALLVLPIALVHMTARYTYKAWIGWELLTEFFKNFGATLYMFLVTIVAALPVLVIVLPILFFIKEPNTFHSEPVLNITHKLTVWVMGFISNDAEPRETFLYTVIKGAFNLSFAILIYTPVGMMSGFVGVFLMRANGLFGYFNTSSLSTVRRMLPGTPATFWVRFQAHVIDDIMFPLTGFLVTSSTRALMCHWFLVLVAVPAYFYGGQLGITAFGGFFVVYVSWMYWVIQESSQLKSTFGKDALGLVVLTEDDKQVPISKANMKWLLRIPLGVIVMPLNLMAAFHPQKRAFHDLATKTKVVWKGDK